MGFYSQGELAFVVEFFDTSGESLSRVSGSVESADLEPFALDTTAPGGAEVADISFTAIGASAVLLDLVSFQRSGAPAECQTVYECLASSEYAGLSGREASLVRLYAAAFLRLPDWGGFDYWRQQDLSIRVIAEYFVSSAEFEQRYGALTDADFVDLMYLNALGRQGDPGGVTYWNSVIENNPRSVVVVGFSESAEFRRRTNTT